MIEQTTLDVPLADSPVLIRFRDLFADLLEEKFAQIEMTIAAAKQ